MIAALLLFATPLAAQEQLYGETIDVVRYVVPARVTDVQGRAILGLTAADFTAAVAGKEAVVESVDWIGGGERSETAEGIPGAAPAGRLVVFFVQTDFARNSVRVLGQIKFNSLADTMLDMLAAEDYVAVASHDSHVKLLCDFTRDRAAARKAINRAIEIRKVPLPPAPDSGPSLARHLDVEEMQRASSAGQALRVVANALSANQGDKVVIIGGWGIGDRISRFVFLDSAWTQAMHTFRAARAPVVTFGTGLGGQLTAGLVATSSQTGGFYAGTQNFAGQSMNRLRGMLSGYYELVLRVEGSLPPGEHAMEIRTARANATVLASPAILVQPPDKVEVVEIAAPEAPRDPGVTGMNLYVDAMRKLLDGNAEEAEALFTRAIDLGDAPGDTWYQRGVLRAARGEMEPAAEDLRTYLQRAPGGKNADEARDLLRAWRE